AWAGGRLLTEAEREFVATARGKNQPYPWGHATPSCNLAVMFGDGNYGCGTGFTMPVCSRPAGNVKLDGGEACDLAGNVWEWTADFWSGYSRKFVKDPRVTTGTNRIYRGGSFSSTGPGYLRAEGRNSRGPDYRDDAVGFRIAR